jgi:hypothetical protein
VGESIFKVDDLVSFPMLEREYLAYVVEVDDEYVVVDAQAYTDEVTILVNVPREDCTILSQSQAAEFQRKLAGIKPGMKGFIDG